MLLNIKMVPYAYVITLFSGWCVLTHAIPLSSPCTEAEMISPITIIHKDIEKMQDQTINGNLMMEQIQKMMDGLPNHLEEIKKSCGEEKVEAMERINKFMTKMQMINDIMSAWDSGDMDKAKGMIENINCEHLIQYIIRKYSTNLKKMEKIMELMINMTDMKLINEMNEAMIYILDDTNIEIAKILIPLMKQQIMTKKEEADEQTMMTAKLNMKEVVKRTIEYCYDGLMAMREIDSEMADQAMYEAIFQKFSDTIYSRAYRMVINAPGAHLKRIGMQAMYDKLIAMEKRNSLSASKIMFMAQKMMENEEIKNDPKSMEIMNNIINESTEFAKNAAEGYSCQDVAYAKALKRDEEVQNMEHNDYFVFYNPEDPEVLNGKFKENAEGDMMLVTVDKLHEGKNIQYKILMKNGNYPEDFHMKGKIMSKKILSKEETTNEELCSMNPKPNANICIPLREMFMWTVEESAKNRNLMYEQFLEHVKVCDKE